MKKTTQINQWKQITFSLFFFKIYAKIPFIDFLCTKFSLSQFTFTHCFLSLQYKCIHNQIECGEFSVWRDGLMDDPIINIGPQSDFSSPFRIHFSNTCKSGRGLMMIWWELCLMVKKWRLNLVIFWGKGAFFLTLLFFCSHFQMDYFHLISIPHTPC